MRIVVNIDNAALRDAPQAVALAARGVLLSVVLLNILLMRTARKCGQPLPKLYRSGVRFEPEPNQGKWEDFADCNTVISRGWGDCDDLVAYRVAELRESGEDSKASIKVYWRHMRDADGRPMFKPNGTPMRVFHAQVRRGNKRDRNGKGLVEDPARLLGM